MCTTTSARSTRTHSPLPVPSTPSSGQPASEARLDQPIGNGLHMAIGRSARHDHVVRDRSELAHVQHLDVAGLQIRQRMLRKRQQLLTAHEFAPPLDWHIYGLFRSDSRTASGTRKRGSPPAATRVRIAEDEISSWVTSCIRMRPAGSLASSRGLVRRPGPEQLAGFPVDALRERPGGGRPRYGPAPAVRATDARLAGRRKASSPSSRQSGRVAHFGRGDSSACPP